MTGNRELVRHVSIPEAEYRTDADEREANSGTDSRDDVEELVVDLDREGRDMLDALADDGCRAILEAATDSVVSVPELSEECDLPRSTTYRKINTLTQLGLIEERACIHRSGGKVNKYTCIAGAIRVDIDGTGDTTLRVTQHSSPPRTDVLDETTGH